MPRHYFFALLVNKAASAALLIFIININIFCSTESALWNQIPTLPAQAVHLVI